jgi:hypothetical protein
MIFAQAGLGTAHNGDEVAEYDSDESSGNILFEDAAESL